MDDQPASSLPSIFDDGDMYDLLLIGIVYGLDFYVALAREAKGPVLDIACGTGRILLPCLQAGVDIEGLDLFEPMLKTLREGGCFGPVATAPSGRHERLFPAAPFRAGHDSVQRLYSQHDARN